jgi:hypothetical protein
MPKVTAHRFGGFAGAAGSPGWPHSDYASAGSANPLETLEPQCSFSRPRPLHALKLGGAFVCTDIFGLAQPQRSSRLVARAAS